MQKFLRAGLHPLVLFSLASSVALLFFDETNAGGNCYDLNPGPRRAVAADEDPGGNHAPCLDPIGSRIASEGQLLQFTISATDPDPADALTFDAGNLPEGAAFDPTTATFSWTPETRQAGTYEDVKFSVTDDGEPSKSDEERITLTVSGPLNTYVLHPVVHVYSQVPDSGPTVIRDRDAPVTVVNFFYRSIPYLKFDLSSIPDSEQVRTATLRLLEIGDWYSLPDVIELFYASNDDWNERTGYEDLPRKTGRLICRSSYPSEGSEWQEWDLSRHNFAGDLRDDSLTLILESNVFSEWRGTLFHGLSRYDDPSQWPQLVIRTVEGLPGNRPPRLDPIGNRAGSEGQLLQFRISAEDPDPDDTLTFTAGNLPEGATFHGPTATFSWVPDYDQAGNYPDIEFAVMDNGDPMELDAELIAITVGNVNRPPVFAPVAPQEVLENQSLAFNVSATDPDGDETTLRYGMDPDTMSCMQGDRGGRCVGYVRDFLGGSWDTMPALCGIHPNCSAYNAWGHWDFGFGSGQEPAPNSVMVLDRGDLPDGHVAVVLSAEDNLDGTYSLVVNESNWDRDLAIDCNVRYTYFAGLSQVTRGTGETRYPVLGFIYGQLASNAAFDGSSSVFRFSPDNTQAGNYTLSFYATDNGEPSETARLEVAVTVGDVPTPTELTEALADATVRLDLPKQVENACLADLKKVRIFIGDGRMTPAMHRLEAFVVRVEHNVAHGDMGEEEGNDLLTIAEDLIAALRSDSGPHH